MFVFDLQCTGYGRMRHKKVTPRLVGSFLSNSREFQGEILHTYLLIMYLHAGINSI